MGRGLIVRLGEHSSEVGFGSERSETTWKHGGVKVNHTVACVRLSLTTCCCHQSVAMVFVLTVKSVSIVSCRA